MCDTALMTSTTQPKPGDIITVRTVGRSQRKALVSVIHIPAGCTEFVLARRVRHNDDGTTSTYGNDRVYHLIGD